jgi:N-acylneuraminate cytidylyltransferase
MPSAVALIPARAGSHRVPGKNVRCLGAHPLLAYAIAAAQASGVFTRIIVSTDSEAYAALARHYGAETPFLRPPEMARSDSPDIEWVQHALETLARDGSRFDSFSILRPTSPFRQATTIRRAWQAFAGEAGVDSLRAIERCAQHPGKMWVVRGQRMHPLLPLGTAERPWHSLPYQSLPEVYVQNASLEWAWTRVVFEQRAIAGEIVMPFITDGLEGFDINVPDDWHLAALYVARDGAILPRVDATPWQDNPSSQGE